MAKILDGKAASAEIRAEVARDVAKMGQAPGVVPGLAAILVGDDPASAVYVRNKEKACDEVGIYTETFRLPHDTSQGELLELVCSLNGNPRFHGILLQLPLPEHIDENSTLACISPDKDVDSIHPMNLGKLALGDYDFVPATPGGVQQLLLRNGYDPSGKHVVICGRSNIVGKPLAMTLMQKMEGANATVTVCHTATRDLAVITSQADILVAATGVPRSITREMVREGAVVVDVGVNRISDPSRKSGSRLVGDVDFDGVYDKVEAISPVPGGVGPMTIAMLLVNTVTAAKLAIRNG